MQCSVCGKSDKVTIGNNDYCSNCGAQMRVAAPPAVRSMDIRRPAPPVAIGPTTTAATPISVPPAVAPKPKKPSFFSRLFAKRTPQPTPMAPASPPAVVTPKPATDFHGRLTPSAAVPTTPSPETTSVITPSPLPVTRKEARQSLAANIAQSSLISKFHKQAAAPAPVVAPPPAAPMTPHISEPAAAKLITPAAQPPPVPAKNHTLSLAAAVASFAIMAGYIWLYNYPKIAAKTAASKAGFEASAPRYLPASFSLSGPVAYSPGEVSFKFAGPGGNIALTQRKSTWDSNTLLDNYVSRKSDQYLAIQGQGLTIYVYNGNQASWVNRGIWYSLEGENKLDRDQILKIAYSL